MNKKLQQLLNLIRVEVAQEGKITAAALRIHIENRCISRTAMMEAARKGMAIYEANEYLRGMAARGFVPVPETLAEIKQRWS